MAQIIKTTRLVILYNNVFLLVVMLLCSFDDYVSMTESWTMTLPFDLYHHRPFLLSSSVHSSCSSSSRVTSRFDGIDHPYKSVLRQRNQQQQQQPRKQNKNIMIHYSSPFEVDLYDSSSSSSSMDEVGEIVVPNHTQLVIGINKYSHDTSICIANAQTGQVYVGMAKERISRKKHDGGNIVSLIEHCLLENPIFHPLHDIMNNPNIISCIIMNHHHYRILPYIEYNRDHMEWENMLQISTHNDDGYEDNENTLHHIPARYELSHHLAHAYSTIIQSRYDTGICFILDGMGDTYRTMYTAIQNNDTHYISDLSFCPFTMTNDENDHYHIHHTFTCIPSNIQKDMTYHTIYDYREAESVYIYTKYHHNRSIALRPIFKRFTKESTPPIASTNYGFENLDSIGAIYSRVSSHIFGDWNSCGKVMGLAPWFEYSWNITTSKSTKNSKTTSSSSKASTKNTIIKPPPLRHPYDTNKNRNNRIMWGKLYTEDPKECFQYDRSYMEGMPYVSRNDPDLFITDMHTGELTMKPRYDFDDNNEQNHDDEHDRILPSKVALDAISLAYHIQNDLQNVVLEFVDFYIKQTNSTNICLAGGVILNSVLNGKIADRYGYDHVHIPPYPGDDGIAVGCCAFGLYHNIHLPRRYDHHFGTVSKQYHDNDNDGDNNKDKRHVKNDMWNKPLAPYLGVEPTEVDIDNAIRDAQLWLEYEKVNDVEQRLDMMVSEIEKGAVIAWYQSKSEFGPRALGHRSILADPRKKGLVRFINQYVKKRETFRPFAPSVLAEEVYEWFDISNHNNQRPVDGNISPYMSITAMVKDNKRSYIPAVTHVDGSSRMQTVTKIAEPTYHRLIEKFFQLTGIPMVLNTSFNTLPKEPIVETPYDAIRSFLYAMNSIEMLVLGPYVIRRKKPNLKHLLGEINQDGTIMKTPPAYPKRTGSIQFQTTGTMMVCDDDDSVEQTSTMGTTTTTKVRMVHRPLHAPNKNEWVELLDDLECEILSLCDGTNTFNDIMEQFSCSEQDDSSTELDDKKTLVQNIVHRLVRLYEETLIGW